MSNADHHQRPSDRPSWHRVFGVIALIGFLASLLVHAATLSGVDVASQLPFVWGLHVGIFVVFVPFVFSARGWRRGTGSLSRLLEIFPGWLIAVGGLLFVYAIINFFVSIGLGGGGSPTMEGGRFILSNKGRFIRELTESEYHLHNAYQLRAFSGHWLIFYFVPFAYFMFGKRPASQISTYQVS